MKCTLRYRLCMIALITVLASAGGALAAKYTWLQNAATALGLNALQTFNTVDIGYLQSMLEHHQQALLISFSINHNTADISHDFARSIIIDQNHESGLLTGLLLAWDQPLVTVQSKMAWLNIENPRIEVQDVLYLERCRANPNAMPGAPSMAEIEQLKRAPAQMQEQIFLKLMIQHHQAALPMSRFEFNNGASAHVQHIAFNVIKKQRAEIAWMTSRLSELEHSPPLQD